MEYIVNPLETATLVRNLLMTKKKNRRNKSKHPNLDPNLNLKSRRDYLDNRYYAKNLDEASKDFLDAFNREYYVADFRGSENVHETKIDIDTVNDIKAQIKAIKGLRERIFRKPPENTTEADREQAELYNEQIEEMESFLNKMYPKRAAEHANNARNRDIINYAKRSNKYDVISWEELRDDELNEVQVEFGEEKVIEGED